MARANQSPGARDARACGVVPLSQLTDDRENDPSRPRLQALSEHLHGHGARAVHEFMVELVAAHGDDVVRRLEAYGRLDAEVIKALGGDRFAPPFAAVGGGRR